MYDYISMANLIDSIRQGISNTGANAIRTISNFNTTAGGKVGKAVDVVGKALGNPFPEAYASENAESAGGNAQYNAAKTPEEKAKVEQKAQQRAGFNSTNIQNSPGQKQTIGQFSVDPNNLDKLIDVGGGQMKTGRTILAETGGTGTYSQDDGGSRAPSFSFNEGLDKAGGAGLVGQYLDQGQADDIMRRYSEGAFGRADDLAAEIERVARENAEREYGDVMSALGVQKEEVARLGGQQKDRALIEKDLTEAELQSKLDTESKDIAKQRGGFIEESEKDRDKLGRAWKDMSLEVQRIMRGRGIADSSFATEKEVGVLKDFNAGLRELSTKKSSALNDFAEAAIETTQFYTRKKVQLAEEVRQRVEDVDNWVRGQVQTIQNQERVSLSKKLADINNAILQGRQIKTDIATKVAETELNFGMWLKQTEVNYKLAVAEAARGKTASAGQTIAQAAALSKNMFTLLENGQAQWVQNKDGTMGLQDAMTGTAIPVRPGYKDEYDALQESKQKDQTLKQYTDAMVLNSLKGSAGNAPEEEDKGLMGTISSFLGR